VIVVRIESALSDTEHIRKIKLVIVRVAFFITGDSPLKWIQGITEGAATLMPMVFREEWR
jgi:hypothetical protein